MELGDWSKSRGYCVQDTQSMSTSDIGHSSRVRQQKLDALIRQRHSEGHALAQANRRFTDQRALESRQMDKSKKEKRGLVHKFRGQF
jgi:hypothetical protein